MKQLRSVPLIAATPAVQGTVAARREAGAVDFSIEDVDR